MFRATLLFVFPDMFQLLEYLAEIISDNFLMYMRIMLANPVAWCYTVSLHSLLIILLILYELVLSFKNR